MVNYRRDYTPGGTYFFTLNLHNRRSHLLTTHINALGDAFRYAREKLFYQTIAMVVLHDHLHAIWLLPQEDSDYSYRWHLIKSHFTRSLIKSGLAFTKNKRGEYNLWQRRFWEHRIRDEIDYQRHINYIHFNPVKHGLVAHPAQWPYSTLHRLISEGKIDKNWGRNKHCSPGVTQCNPGMSHYQHDAL